MKDYAETIYHNVMETTRTTNEDYDMYENSLKSLGMHVDVRRRKPTAATIYAKLMK